MDIEQKIAARVTHIEEIIRQYLPKEEGFQKTIFEAMNYSILAGGKRLRPMIMEETYHMFGGTSRVIEPFMAAPPVDVALSNPEFFNEVHRQEGNQHRVACAHQHGVEGENGKRHLPGRLDGFHGGRGFQCRIPGSLRPSLGAINTPKRGNGNGILRIFAFGDRARLSYNRRTYF